MVKYGRDEGFWHRWASPEQLMGPRVGLPSDIWSLGTLLLDICTGDCSTRRETRELQVPEEAPQAVQDLINDCRNAVPAKRPTAFEFYSRLLAAGPRQV